MRRSGTVTVAGRDVVALGTAPGRISVGLVIPAVGRVVDLTVAPSAAVACLEGAAAEAGVPLGPVRAELRSELARLATEVGSWHPTTEADLVAELGGACFPMLGEAYERGASPVAEVPRWAASVLAAPSVRAAATAAFGPRATRPVVRALAATLAGVGGGGPVGLAALALGLTGARVLEPDALVRVLQAGHEAEPGPPMTVDELAACTTVVRALGPRRGERILCAAAGAAGTRTLLDVARVWPDVASRLPAHPPGRLAELADQCRALVVTDPGPLPARPPRRARSSGAGAGAGASGPSSRRRAPGRREPTGGRARNPGPAPAGAPRLPPAEPRLRTHAGEQGGRYAPDASGPVTPMTTVPASARLARLDGWETEGIRFSRPRTCGDLERWGRMLGSCVGTFGPAAVAGRSELLAIHRGLELRGCLELTPAGTIRQLLGPANRRLDLPTRRIVLSALVTRGEIDPRAADNRIWYDTRA